MRDNKLQTKRQAKTGFRALYARTVKKRQHAATAASANELDGDVPSVGIGRALTVILVLHIVAIAAIWVGINWQGSDNSASNSAITSLDDKESDKPKLAIAPPIDENVGRLTRDRPASYGTPNRSNNNGTQASNNNQSNGMVSDRPDLGLNNAQPARQPRVIKPRRNPNLAAAPAVVRTKKYVIAAGDSIYRIALKNNVKQAEVMAVNPGLVARKIQPGQVILVPIK